MAKCRRRRWRRRRPGTRGGCARPGPGGPRSCGCSCDAQRSPGASLSGFMARHIEQPGSRQSKPAAGKTRSSPSASACAFTAWLPGTTRVRTPAATVRPVGDGGGGPEVLDAAVGARADEHGVDGDVAHRRAGGRGPCTRAPGAAASRWPGSAKLVGVGHDVVDRDDLARVRAPADTCGRERGGVEDDLLVEGGAVVGDERRASRRAPAPTPSPVGAWRRPSRYANVVSSGAISPALAPASIDMLQTVMRPSIERARMAEPRYSMIEPMPPPVPMRPMIARIDVLGGDARRGSSPSTVTAIVPGPAAGAASGWRARARPRWCRCRRRARRTRRGWRCGCRRTRSVMPGSVRPCSGPITWTMPWPGSPIG